MVYTGTEEVTLNAPSPLPPPATEVIRSDRKISDFVSLTKPEITFLVTISAFAGYILGFSGDINYSTLLALLFGVAFSSSGGAALNHYVERDRDRQMKRTDDRPLPSGRITPLSALLFGAICSLIGLTLLFLFTNVLTTVLAGLTILLYVLLYTPLKTRTKYNTLVGTIPGALPALGGWTAASGSLGLGGWIIFSILLIWQLPHFFALAWMYRKDYDRAGFQMLPVVEPDGRSTANQVLVSSILLLIVCLLPSAVGLTGMIYFAGAFAISSWLLLTSIRFHQSLSNNAARKVLKASVIHIPVLVILLVIDRFI